MNLLKIYQNKNSDKKWFEDHCSSGEDASGKMFKYTGTNARNLESFMSQFKMFLKIENIPRNKWPRQVKHGQEVHKQYVVPMIQSKLFKKKSDELYDRTTKGSLYKKFIDSDIKEGERWLINYIFLINGYYFNRKNYIIHRVKEDLLGFFLSIDGVNEDQLIRESKNLLKTNSFKLALKSDFFFMHSFYDDVDFLTVYLRASKDEKMELVSYIENNIKNKNFICCISKKYKSTGIFSYSTLIEETKVFLLTLLFTESKNANLNSIYKIFIKNFSENIQEINKKEVFSYLIENKEVFDPIFEDILEIEDIEIELPQEVVLERIEKDRQEDYIDETSEIGRQKIKAIYSLRKKQARIQSGYKCALESLNNCKSIYFTAKANKKNYLELHHLIPQEFRNDFSYSIEVLANYVTLCPRCHRQIHLAIDNERKSLINALYEARRERLELVGLRIENDKIHEYYKID